MNRDLVTFAFWASIVDAAICVPLVWVWGLRSDGALTQQQELGVTLVNLSYTVLCVLAILGLREVVRFVMNSRRHDQTFVVLCMLFVMSVPLEFVSVAFPDSKSWLETALTILSLAGLGVYVYLFLSLRSLEGPFKGEWYWFCVLSVTGSLLVVLAPSVGVAFDLMTSLWCAWIIRRALAIDAARAPAAPW